VRLVRVAVLEEPDPAFVVLVQALSLDGGLPQAIELTRQHAPAILLTDDAAARLAAEAFSLRAYGTLGVLVRAARRKLRTPEAVVDLLEQVGAHSSLCVRADLLASVVERLKIEHDLD
jgi:predicted nucleic acid-binding protein